VSDISNPDLNYGLHLIEKNLFEIDKILSTFDFPTPVYDWSFHNVNPLINHELDYDETAEQTSRDNAYD